MTRLTTLITKRFRFKLFTLTESIEDGSTSLNKVFKSGTSKHRTIESVQRNNVGYPNELII